MPLKLLIALALFASSEGHPLPEGSTSCGPRLEGALIRAAGGGLRLFEHPWTAREPHVNRCGTDGSIVRRACDAFR